MSVKKWIASISVSLSLCGLNSQAEAIADNAYPALARAATNEQELSRTDFITVEELKAKLARGEPVTIIDVRTGYGLRDGDNKIKGAIYVKLRRLKSRLAFSPLKDVSLNQETVTYCACPNDESSVRAAQILLDSGFTRVRVLKGGWMVWKKANGPVEPLAKVM